MSTKHFRLVVAGACVAAAAVGGQAVGSAHAEQKAPSAGSATRVCFANVDTGSWACGSSRAAVKRAAPRAVASRDLVVLFYNLSYDGVALIWTGSHACTASTSDTEFWANDLGQYGVSNVVTSVATMSSCDVKLYDGTNFTGSSTGFLDYHRNLTSLSFNDRASSMKIS